MPRTKTEKTAAEKTPQERIFGELAELSRNLSCPPAETKAQHAESKRTAEANGAKPVESADAALEHAPECEPPTEDGLFSLLDPYCSREYREQFRLLRTQLMLHRTRFAQEKDFRVVCVMSTHKGEGKSFTASNLAAMLAVANGQKVLLIDSDARSRPVPIGLALSEDAGLPSALAAPGDWAKAVHRVKGTSLYVLARGTVRANRESTPPLASRSARDLNLAALPELLGVLREYFEWIILDGAAFAVCPDAPWLTSVADGTLLVICENASRFCAVQESLASIPPERFVGVVFNKRRKKSEIKVRLRIRVGRGHSQKLC